MSFEPLPEVAAVIQANIDANDFRQVMLIRAAVSDVSGTANLHRSSKTPHGHTSLSSDPSAWQQVIPCDLVRLDDVVPRSLWDRVSLIKLDVEGAELAALRGADALLRYSGAKVIIEINPGTARRSGYETAEIFDLMSSLGYAGYVWTRSEWIAVSAPRADLTANVLFQKR
jgi:FkbM family methyltransferase